MFEATLKVNSHVRFVVQLSQAAYAKKIDISTTERLDDVTHLKRILDHGACLPLLLSTIMK